MKRREFIVLLGGVAAGLGSAALAQPIRQRRIAYLHPAIPNPSSQGYANAWRAALTTLGWVEGSTVSIETHWAEGNADRLQQFVEDAVQRKVDLLLTIGQAVFPASEATKTVPIVAINLETDPVAAGLVQSLGRPGGNVTGMFLSAPELGTKQLQILKEVVPNLVRVAVLSEPKVSGYQLAAISATSGQLGVAITSLSYRGPKDIDGILASMTAANIEGLIVLSSPLVNGESPAIAELALKARVPSISLFRPFCEHGGLIYYGPKLVDLFRRAASTVDQILRGAKPADLPVELPTRFETVINLKTAKVLGLTVPATLLARADEVIE